MPQQVWGFSELGGAGRTIADPAVQEQQAWAALMEQQRAREQRNALMRQQLAQQQQAAGMGDAMAQQRLAEQRRQFDLSQALQREGMRFTGQESALDRTSREQRFAAEQAALDRRQQERIQAEERARQAELQRRTAELQQRRGFQLEDQAFDRADRAQTDLDRALERADAEDMLEAERLRQREETKEERAYKEKQQLAEEARKNAEFTRRFYLQNPDIAQYGPDGLPVGAARESAGDTVPDLQRQKFQDSLLTDVTESYQRLLNDTPDGSPERTLGLQAILEATRARAINAGFPEVYDLVVSLLPQPEQAPAPEPGLDLLDWIAQSGFYKDVWKPTHESVSGLLDALVPDPVGEGVRDATGFQPHTQTLRAILRGDPGAALSQATRAALPLQRAVDPVARAMLNSMGVEGRGTLPDALNETTGSMVGDLATNVDLWAALVGMPGVEGLVNALARRARPTSFGTYGGAAAAPPAAAPPAIRVTPRETPIPPDEAARMIDRLSREADMAAQYEVQQAMLRARQAAPSQAKTMEEFARMSKRARTPRSDDPIESMVKAYLNAGQRQMFKAMVAEGVPPAEALSRLMGM